jgi:hypothetical protein
MSTNTTIQKLRIKELKEEKAREDRRKAEEAYKSLSQKQSQPQKTGNGIESIYGILIQWHVRTNQYENKPIKTTSMHISVTNVESTLKEVKLAGNYAAIKNGKLIIPKNNKEGPKGSKVLKPVLNDNDPEVLYDGRIIVVQVSGEMTGLITTQPVRLDSVRIEIEPDKTGHMVGRIKCGGVKHMPFNFKNRTKELNTFYSTNSALPIYKGFECLLSDIQLNKRAPDTIILDTLNKNELGPIFISSKDICVRNGSATIRPFSYTTMTEQELLDYKKSQEAEDYVSTSIYLENPYVKRENKEKDKPPIEQLALLGKLLYSRDLKYPTQTKETLNKEFNKTNNSTNEENTSLKEEMLNDHQLQDDIEDQNSSDETFSDIPDVSHFDDLTKRKGDIDFKYYGINMESAMYYNEGGAQDLLCITDPGDFDGIVKFNIPDVIAIPEKIEKNKVTPYLDTENYETTSKSTICIPNTLGYLLNCGLLVPNDFVLKDIAAMYNDIELIGSLTPPQKGAEENLWFKSKFLESNIPGSHLRSNTISTLYKKNFLNTKDFGFINTKEYNGNLEEYQLKSPTVSRVLFGRRGMLLNQESGSIFTNDIFSYKPISSQKTITEDSEESIILNAEDIINFSKTAYLTKSEDDIAIAEFWSKQLIRLFFIVKIFSGDIQNFQNIKMEYIKIYCKNFNEKFEKEAKALAKLQKIDAIDFNELKNQNMFKDVVFVSYSIKDIKEQEKEKEREKERERDEKVTEQLPPLKKIKK